MANTRSAPAFTLEQQKKAAAYSALKFINSGELVGVGSGSTVSYFIEALATIKARIDAAVPSSRATEALLRQYGIRVLDLNAAGNLPLYVDGTDRIDPHLVCIKGGGGALTREKIIAQASARFVCIADQSKLLKFLSDSVPLPVEVITTARSFLSRQFVAMGGVPQLRDNFISDEGHAIVDVRGLDLSNPVRMEEHINQMPGVVSVGLFARRRADILLLAGADGVKEMTAATKVSS